MAIDELAALDPKNCEHNVSNKPKISLPILSLLLKVDTKTINC